MKMGKRLRMPFVGDGLIRWGRFNAKTWTNGEDFDCLMTNRWKIGYVNRGSDVIVGNVAGDVMGSGRTNKSIVYLISNAYMSPGSS